MHGHGKTLLAKSANRSVRVGRCSKSISAKFIAVVECGDHLWRMSTTRHRSDQGISKERKACT